MITTRGCVPKALLLAITAVSLLGRGNVENVARVGFGNAAIIDDDLVRGDRHFNATNTFFSCLHQYADALLAGWSLDHDGNFCSSTTAVLDGCSHQVILFFLAKQWPRIHRLHMKIRKPAITVYPVVEEPLQIALRAGLNEPLQITGVFVGTAAIGCDGAMHGFIAKHVAQHPKNESAFAA